MNEAVLERTFDRVAVDSLPSEYQQGFEGVRHVRVRIEAEEPKKKRPTVEESLAFIRSLRPKEPLVNDVDLYDYLYEDSNQALK